MNSHITMQFDLHYILIDVVEHHVLCLLPSVYLLEVSTQIFSVVFHLALVLVVIVRLSASFYTLETDTFVKSVISKCSFQVFDGSFYFLKIDRFNADEKIKKMQEEILTLKKYEAIAKTKLKKGGISGDTILGLPKSYFEDKHIKVIEAIINKIKKDL